MQKWKVKNYFNGINWLASHFSHILFLLQHYKCMFWAGFAKSKIADWSVECRGREFQIWFKKEITKSVLGTQTGGNLH